MAKINLTPLSNVQGLDNDQAIRRIESYLFQLNEQLRYELTHIDEDNMAANNTTAYSVSAGSEESGGSAQVNGNTIDLNDNTLIIQLKSRLTEIQKNQETAFAGINKNTQSITNALKDISSLESSLYDLRSAYRNHRHSISIDGGGNLSMGGPTASPTFPNIADTAFVQAMVSAVAQDGPIQLNSGYSPIYFKAMQAITCTVVGQLTNGNSIGGTVLIQGGAVYDAYKAGWNDCLEAASEETCYTGTARQLYDDVLDVYVMAINPYTRVTRYTLPAPLT